MHLSDWLKKFNFFISMNSNERNLFVFCLNSFSFFLSYLESFLPKNVVLSELHWEASLQKANQCCKIHRDNLGESVFVWVLRRKIYTSSKNYFRCFSYLLIVWLNKVNFTPWATSHRFFLYCENESFHTCFPSQNTYFDAFLNLAPRARA